MTVRAVMRREGGGDEKVLRIRRFFRLELSINAGEGV